MYIPRHFGLEDRPQISEFVAAAGAAHLVTFDGAELTATLLPVIWDQDDGTSHASHTSGNGDGDGPATGACSATSRWPTASGRPRSPAFPRWPSCPGRRRTSRRAGTPASAEHGRVVPTWNYVTVHFTGPVAVHHDPAWVRGRWSPA